MTPPVKKRCTSRPGKKSQSSGQPAVLHSEPMAGSHVSGLLQVATYPQQIAAMFSLCFPMEVRCSLLDNIRKEVSKFFSEFAPPTINQIDTLIACLSSGYIRTREVMSEKLLYPLRVEVVPTAEITHTVPDAILLDCILSRVNKKPRVNRSSKFSETIIKTRVTKSLLLSEHDELFRTIILIFPHAGVFYTSARTMMLHDGALEPCTTFTPLPYSWLRLKFRSGQPAAGAFIKKIHKSWTFNYLPTSNATVSHCLQFSDEQDGCPLMVPDLIQGVMYEDPRSARPIYRHLLETSSSNKFGCRRYVRGAFHKSIPPTCFVYDQRKMGDMIFHVTTHDDSGRPETQSVVNVTSVAKNSSLLQSLERGVASFIERNSFKGNARYYCGDEGHMNGIGLMTRHSGGSIIEAKLGTEKSLFTSNLPTICCLASEFCQQKFPGVLSTIHHLEGVGGYHRPSYLGGSQGVSSSMALSVDLINSTHYDVNDGSVGFFIATESIPGDAENWYFVLPNILLKYNGITYEGLSVQLFHGCSISFDGRVIRHGTSHHHSKGDNHTIGWYWGLNARTFSASSTSPSSESISNPIIP